MIVERYLPAASEAWDAFVGASRNGTFLLQRGYMDYHRDRFEDHSLVFRDEKGRLQGVLPANRAGDALQSHGGLTYGGLVLAPSTGTPAVLRMFDALRGYLREHGLARLEYKTIPWIYHRQPAEDDRYALFRNGARLTRRDVLSVVLKDDRLKYQERRARGVKSARKAGVAVLAGHAADFWPILAENLQARFGVGPVHSLDEIELLRARFPERIRVFCAEIDGACCAGVVVYETDTVAHVQYISANDAGRRVHALDAVFDHLLATAYRDKPCFDFGISNEAGGTVLNEGLVEQKEGFGARAVAHDYYELGA